MWRARRRAVHDECAGERWSRVRLAAGRSGALLLGGHLLPSGHNSAAPITLLKWYTDVLLDDGAVLLVYQGVVHAFGVRIARATAELFRPTRECVRDRSRNSVVDITGDHSAIGSVRFDARGLTFATERLSGTLSFTEVASPLTLLRPFLTDGRRSLDWHVEVPDAHVEGALVVDGAQRRVRGRGYRDRVTTDIAPWRLPIRALSWGRAVGGRHRASWVDASLRDGSHRIASFVDETVRHDVPGVPPEVALDDGRVLLSARVMTHAPLALGALRALGRLAYGDPREEKRAGRARVVGEAGFAIWETVLFAIAGDEGSTS